MEFGITGKATPRSYQRHIPGTSSRGRPQSGKQSINPITGEEMFSPTPRQQQYQKHIQPSNGKKDNVPSLNLHYLKDDDFSTGPSFDIDLNDYSLDSPGSVSTVSWGTSRSTYGMKEKPQAPVISTRQSHGVPGLDLGTNMPPSARKPAAKAPSAWDVEAVPNNLPAPSARHQQLYQQYSNEMKESYRAHTEQQLKVKQKEEKSRVHSDVEEKYDDSGQHTVIKESLTKQKYTGKQLLKKLDAEDLLEYNKKQKLVETVMIDQLSRAVISDPQQNTRSTYRESSSSSRRGSNRHLHDSRVKPASTATENLLSRRVRFGARIMTRNAQDAMRELTGFYFDYDKTMTVYEFRKFGKSAKAMPFIYRGQYLHQEGPKQRKPYSLTDIYSGSNLKIPTKGQLALTDTLSKVDIIVLRVTDVDECEKDLIIEGREDYDERDHAPSKLEMDNRDFLSRIQGEVARQICKRGIKVVTGLGRFYRRMDQYKTGILDQFDLEKGVKTYRINLNQDTLEDVFDVLDPSGTQLLDYVDYMHGILGEMSEYRKALVRKAFKKLTIGNKGVIYVTDVKKFYNGNIKGSDPGVSALQTFLADVREDDKNECISYIEFDEYYEGLSLGVENDEDFANILRNTWNV